jgi:uncharacterized membrane protein HdeD (DUF308 family)
MLTRFRDDPAEMAARVGTHWGWVLGFGIATVVLAVIVLAWPGPTLLVVAVLFGIQLIVMGIFRLVGAIAADELTGGNRVLLALLGVLSLIIGLYAVRHVLLTLLALALVLGIFWIVSGTIELFTALSHRQMRARGWIALVGILSVLAGLVVLVYPGISLLVLAVFLSIWLLLFGAMQIVLAFQLRSLRQGPGPGIG